MNVLDYLELQKRAEYVMSYIPKYILKRMIPEDSFFNVCKKVAGKPDAFGFYIVNVISPLTVPSEIPSDPKELAKLAGVDDLSKLITVTLDGKALAVDLNKVELRYENKSVTLKNLKDAAGVTIPVGGKLALIYDYPGGLKEGEHELVVKVGIGGNVQEISAKRVLKKERVALKYPPVL
nr:hypothetical protein [Candidatus Sigynarchaeota archaeon]